MTDQKFWSVTSILSILDKPGLLYWTAIETARSAVKDQEQWQEIIKQDGEEMAIKWLSNARFRKPERELSATQLGIDIHNAIEIITLDGQRPKRVHPDVEPFLVQFERWLEKFQPTFINTEFTVYDPQNGYAGTCDGVIKLDGTLYSFDYKTTRKSRDNSNRPTRPYPEVGLQLTAYRHAEYLLKSGEPRRTDHKGYRVYLYGDREANLISPNIQTEAGLAIHITPDHCHAHLVYCDREFWRIFLHLLSVFRTTVHDFPNVVGEKL